MKNKELRITTEHIIAARGCSSCLEVFQYNVHYKTFKFSKKKKKKKKKPYYCKLVNFQQ